MKTFTIDSENNITVFASIEEAKASNQTDAVIFTSPGELAKLAAHWPTHRLVDLWNSLSARNAQAGLPGLTPVKKFTDRKTAIARIWKAIQSLEPAAETPKTATPSRDVATERAAKNKIDRKAKAEKEPATEAKTPREGSKNAAILELLRRPEGATLNELTAATGWQAHSVRGFLSAVVCKKLGLKLESRKRDDGQRVYSVS